MAAVVTIVVALGIVAALFDVRTRHVPNAITVTALALATVGRLLASASILPALLGVGAIHLAWKLGWMGGADAKLFSAFLLLWPQREWIVVWSVSLLVGYVVYRLKRGGDGRFPAAFPVAVGAVAHYLYLCQGGTL